nr:uncharacterized protein LOC100186521 [Ciona intestinalis]|eukprot:XP_018667319.1 uncharacterized protein LOC100186521 [Ciona intestinalis]
MFDQASPWLSFGYSDKKKPQLKVDNLALDHQHNRQNDHKTLGPTLMGPNKRQEKQKRRVMEAVHKRMLERRVTTQREFLQGFNHEYIESIISQEPSNELYLHKFFNSQGDESGFVSDEGTFSVKSDKRNYQRRVTPRTRPRPQSAPFARRNHLMKETKFDAAIIPISSGESTAAGDHMRPASAQVYRRNSRAGCEHCPVDCRPLSSSSHRPTSSTGLQVTNGPSHFHYYHYNRYLRYQRPKSAIAMRREYLESSKRNKPEVSPRFTFIVRSCKVYDKPNSTEHKPPPTTATVKEAWTEPEPEVPHARNMVSIDTLHEDIPATEVQDEPTQLADEITQVNEDDELDAGVRLQAEVSYQLATDDEGENIKVDNAEIPRAPTPTPIQSRPESPEVEKQDLLPVPPIIYQSTDLLSGRTNAAYATVEMDGSEESVDFGGIRVEIRTPEPLPVKRVPVPTVQKVDIVGPREELVLSPDIPEIVDPIVSDEEYGNNDDDEVIKVEIDKSPVSILKHDDNHARDKSPPRVTFLVPNDEHSDITPQHDVIKVEDPPVKVDVEKTDVSEKLVDPPPLPPGPTKVNTELVFKETKQEIKPTPTPPAPSPTPPAPPLYEEPNDEDVRKLLLPPDLSEFKVPSDLTYSASAKKKSRKSLSPGRKKKKKKKKRERKEVPKKEPEPLFEYDPNAPDPIEEARREIMNRRGDNTDLAAAVVSMKLFDEQCKEKIKNQPWLFGRMALSRNICRFWIPMDVRELEGLSPAQYLSKYCVITKRRFKLYSQAFDRQLQKRKSKDTSVEVKTTLDIKECERALRDVHSNCINDEQVSHVRDLVCINNKDTKGNVSRINSALFCQICALTERLFYSHFVTEDNDDEMTSQKQRIEDADFDGLEWKLRGVAITKELRRLLFNL